MQPIQFDNSYRKLPERFYQVLDPTPVGDPALIAVNEKLAGELGIDPDYLKSDIGISVVAGNLVPEGSEPIASVYAGHQFGNWNPRLGDGRAVLLGETLSDTGGRFDLQLKGSGPTLYSRGGDGRAPIGPVLREYMISEAMQALGVPTSRTLSAVTTGESVMREETLPGAVLLRVASSHIRFGTFQYFMSISDTEAIKLLADHVIARHYPDLDTSETPYKDLFARIIEKTAQLVAKWQAIGFIHGVMNTDNMLVCGETIDYGPCAFMDTYHPETVFSSIDVGGRYAYQNQPGIAHWNLAALAQCFVPLLSDNEDEGVELARSELENFPQVFYKNHRLAMANKIGFELASDETDGLARDLLTQMAEQELDFTNTFTELRLKLKSGETFEGLGDWWQEWTRALGATEDAIDLMSKSNPVIIPRNHLIERAIQAGLSGDLSVFHELNQVFADPYSDRWLETEFTQPPTESETVKQTFCGT